jgi:23S rRNA (cytosine1962-C5)-methyltransferase
VFSGAVQRIEGEPADGDVVDVVAHDGEFLARGYLNRRSQIVVRLLTWDPDEAVDRGFWRRRLEAAIEARRVLPGLEDTDAYRLVHAESDGLPGLVVDRYGDYLVVQFLTLGVDRRKVELVTLLEELVQPRGILERSDVDVREKEGLGPVTGPLAGHAPPPLVVARESGHRFWVDLWAGQKTGFYLDQRENRRRVARYCAGREVLNAFAYTGAFAVYALAVGASHVTNVESSAEALELGRRNLALNRLDASQVEDVAGDVFQVLRSYRDAGRSFDLIILDPPKFAYSQAQVRAACRGYKDINLLAMRLLRPGGVLCTFSCSGVVSADLFQKVVFGAALDARRDVQVLERLAQGPDHPLLLTFPEGEYLKGLICRVM